MVNRWKELSELSSLIRVQPELEPFALKHLDETGNYDDIRRIAKLARDDCP